MNSKPRRRWCRVWYWALVCAPAVGSATANLIPATPTPAALQWRADAAAVVRPDAATLWVVAPTPLAVPPLAQVRSSGVLGVAPLTVVGGYGVALQHPPGQVWSAQIGDGLVQVYRGGAGAGRVPQYASAIVLRDALQLATQQAPLLARDASGQRLQVFPVATHTVLLPPVAAGALQSVPSLLGAAVRHPTPLVARAGVFPVLDVTAIAPAAGPEVTTSATTALATALATSSDTSPTAATDAADYVAVTEQLPEIVRPHNPELAVPFQLDQERALGQRQQDFIRAFGAIQEATQQVDKTVGTAREQRRRSQQEQAPTQQRAIQVAEGFFRQLKKNELQDFPAAVAHQLAVVLEVDGTPQGTPERLELARLYVGAGRYVEAQGVLGTLLQDQNGLPAIPIARVMYGALDVMRGRFKEALDILEPMQGAVTPHSQVWYAAARAELAYATAEWQDISAALNQTLGLVRFYPKDVYLRLRLLEAKSLLNTLQYNSLFELLDALSAEMPWGMLPPEGELYKARAFLQLGDTEQGRRLLAKLGNQMEDPGIAAQAKLYFIQDLARTKDLGNEQMIDFLEDLRFEWRGDQFEGDVLKQLGQRYVLAERFRDALTRWKSYIEGFSNARDIPEVTADMRDAFLEVFASAKELSHMSDLEVLGLYYDFRELVPADATGAQVVEKVAQTLDDTTLYERAIELFSGQLDFSQHTPQREMELALNLSASYRKADQPDSAFATLEKWFPNETEGLSFRLKRDYLVERASVLFALGDFTTAKAQIRTQLDTVSQRLLVDIAWADEDYPLVNQVLSQKFDTREHPGFTDQRTRTDFIRLVYSLVRTKEQAALRALLANYKQDLSNQPDMRDLITVYAAELRVPETELEFTTSRPLQRIGKQLIQLNHFEEEYAKLLRQVAERQKQREIFNEKMRYMDFMRENNLL